MKWVLLLALAAALLPSVAAAEDGRRNGDLLLRIRGDVVVAQGEVVGSVVVIDGNAVIEGTVKDTAMVIKGDLTVRGRVEGDAIAISGDIEIARGASVKNVTSIRGDLTYAAGTVSGEITERDGAGLAGGVLAVFSLVLWLSMTVAMVVAGLVFAWVGGRQLKSAARTMTGDPAASVIGAVCVWIGIPIVAVIAIVTLVGLPVGLGLLIFVLPTLGFLGYLVAGTRLGSAVTGAVNRGQGEHPYLAAAVGVILLQLALLVPVIGGLIAAVAGLWGAGALAAVAYRGASGRTPPAEPAEAPAPATA